MKSLLFSFSAILYCLACIPSCTKDDNTTVVHQPVEQLLKYTKTPCFGFCDTYTFTLFSDNMACLDGEMYSNELSSRATYSESCLIVKSDLWNLISEKAIHMNLDLMEAEYPVDGVLIPDLATKFIEIKLGDNLVKIKETYDAPDKLIEFEKYLEKIIHDFSLRLPITSASNSKLEKNPNLSQ